MSPILPVVRQVVRPGILPIIPRGPGGGGGPPVDPLLTAALALNPVWLYDHKDIGSFFTDVAMTTPASVNDENGVGAVEDRSGNSYHRTQPTAESKPILRGTPLGPNLITNPTYENNAEGWTLAGSLVPSPPNWLIFTASGEGYIGQGFPTEIGRLYRLQISTLANISAGLNNAVVRVTSTAAFDGTLIAEYANSVGVGVGGFEFYFVATTTTTYAWAGSRLGTGFIGIGTITVKDATADVVGAPYTLDYDGVDDFMVTPTIDLSATDKLTACMGLRKKTDGLENSLIELSTNPATSNGAFYVAATAGDGRNAYGFLLRGTAVAQGRSASSFIAPEKDVVSAVFDISQATIWQEILPRINGALSQDNIVTAGPAGTGNFGNYAFYFGSRAGTSRFASIQDGGGALYAQAYSGSDLLAIELFASNRVRP